MYSKCLCGILGASCCRESLFYIPLLKRISSTSSRNCLPPAIILKRQYTQTRFRHSPVSRKLELHFRACLKAFSAAGMWREQQSGTQLPTPSAQAAPFQARRRNSWLKLGIWPGRGWGACLKPQIVLVSVPLTLSPKQTSTFSVSRRLLD